MIGGNQPEEKDVSQTDEEFIRLLKELFDSPPEKTNELSNKLNTKYADFDRNKPSTFAQTLQKMDLPLETIIDNIISGGLQYSLIQQLVSRGMDPEVLLRAFMEKAATDIFNANKYASAANVIGDYWYSGFRDINSERTIRSDIYQFLLKMDMPEITYVFTGRGTLSIPEPILLSKEEFIKRINEIFSAPPSMAGDLIAKLPQQALSQIVDDYSSGHNIRIGLTVNNIIDNKRYDLFQRLLSHGMNPLVLLKKILEAASEDNDFAHRNGRYVKAIDTVLQHIPRDLLMDKGSQTLRKDLFIYMTQAGRPEIAEVFSKYIDFPVIPIQEIMQTPTDLLSKTPHELLTKALFHFQDKEMSPNLATYYNNLLEFWRQKLIQEGSLPKIARETFYSFPMMLWLQRVLQSAPNKTVCESCQNLLQDLSAYQDEEFHQKALNVKMLAGHLNLDAKLNFKSTKPNVDDYKINIDGHDPSWTFPSIAESFNAFRAQTKEDAELQAVFDEASTALASMAAVAQNPYLPEIPKTILAQSKDSPAIVPSGCVTHSANYGLAYIPEIQFTMLSTLNRGAGTEGYNAGIVNALITKPENLTEDLIKRMLSYHGTSPEDFGQFYQVELVDLLGLKFVSKQEASRQSASSCVTVSGDMALRSILTAAFRKHFLAKNESFEKAQRNAEIHADKWFKKWSAFDRNYYFDKYIQDPANQPLSYDLLAIELFRHHDPNKPDEVYRVGILIPLLKQMDEPKLVAGIIKRLLEYKRKGEGKNYQDLSKMIEKIDKDLAKKCIDAVSDKYAKEIEENFQRFEKMIKANLAEWKKYDFDGIEYNLNYLFGELHFTDLVDPNNESKDIFLLPYAKADGTTLFEVAEKVEHEPTRKALLNLIKKKMTEKLGSYIATTTADSGFKVFHSDLNCLKTLLDQGAQIKPLYSALMSNADPKMIEFIIKNKYVNINEPDAEGKTLLMHACARDNLDVAQKLMALGADLSRKDNAGKTFQDHIRNGKKSVLREAQMIRALTDEAPKLVAEKPTTHRKSTLLVQPLSKRHTNIGELKPPRPRKVLFSKETKSKQSVTKHNVKRKPKGKKPANPEGR